MSQSQSPVNITVPQPNVSFIAPDGSISRPWLYYLIGLFYRTGGNTPIIPDDLQNQINALFVEEAFNDLQERPVPVSFPVFMGEAMADTPMPLVAPILFGQFMADDVPRAVMNPIIAALMVSD